MQLTYMIYQAERTMSSAEQRAADRRAGELAKSLASLWHSVTALRARRRGIRRGRLAADQSEPIDLRDCPPAHLAEPAPAGINSCR
jgi:hypothetical protein